MTFDSKNTTPYLSLPKRSQEEVRATRRPSGGVLLRAGGLDAQVCVPKDWSDEQAVAFAESAYPCGTENGWQIRRAGDKDLNGDPERVQCADDAGRVHIMLDA